MILLNDAYELLLDYIDDIGPKVAELDKLEET